MARPVEAFDIDDLDRFDLVLVLDSGESIRTVYILTKYPTLHAYRTAWNSSSALLKQGYTKRSSRRFLIKSLPNITSTMDKRSLY